MELIKINIDFVPPHRYGTGAENVLEYTLVTATGDIVTVDQHHITKKNYNGEEVNVNRLF